MCLVRAMRGADGGEPGSAPGPSTACTARRYSGFSEASAGNGPVEAHLTGRRANWPCSCLAGSPPPTSS
jgi:hypothetical protein